MLFCTDTSRSGHKTPYRRGTYLKMPVEGPVIIMQARKQAAASTDLYNLFSVPECQ